MFMLKAHVKSISDLQSVLYADHKWSLLLIFQAMNAAGKDSTVKNVLSGVNLQRHEDFEVLFEYFPVPCFGGITVDYSIYTLLKLRITNCC